MIDIYFQKFVIKFFFSSAVCTMALRALAGRLPRLVGFVPSATQCSPLSNTIRTYAVLQAANGQRHILPAVAMQLSPMAMEQRRFRNRYSGFVRVEKAGRKPTKANMAWFTFLIGSVVLFCFTPL